MSFRILIVENLATNAELAARELKRAGMEPILRRVETEAEFVRKLAEFDPHVILSDFSLPRFSGPDALELALQKRPVTPFIFVSGTRSAGRPACTRTAQRRAAK
jgi:CheY-like chemotaxis protein